MAPVGIKCKTQNEEGVQGAGGNTLAAQQNGMFV